jgi:hypothetical protein
VSLFFLTIDLTLYDFVQLIAFPFEYLDLVLLSVKQSLPVLQHFVPCDFLSITRGDHLG